MWVFAAAIIHGNEAGDEPAPGRERFFFLSCFSISDFQGQYYGNTDCWCIYLHACIFFLFFFVGGGIYEIFEKCCLALGLVMVAVR